MQNQTQPGKVLDLPAPYDRLSGQGALIGSIFGVASHDVLSGVTGAFVTEGVHTLPKTSAQAWVVGDPVYWDDTNKRCDNTNVGRLVGAATAAAANPSSTGSLKLNEAVQSQTVSAVAALTDNSGGASADGTIAAVSDVATAANAIKELATKQNELISKLHAVGILAP